MLGDSLLSVNLPEPFINYVFRERVKLLKKLAKGGGDKMELYVSFTRVNPVVITYGPAGLNGSVKMIGFIPKQEYLSEMLNHAYEVLKAKDLKGISYVVNELINYFYDPGKLDLTRFGALEMAFGHTWVNIKATGKATLLFYTPPVTSYEVRCDVSIEDSGPIKDYLNVMHDLYHGLGSQGRSNYPAYVFKVREIYDQSASKNGFGRMIFKQ